MRAVVQRVSEASVAVDGAKIAEIGPGLLVLVAVAPDDGQSEVAALAGKLSGLRVFRDAAGKMNLSVADVGGEVLVVSQFTLLGDLRKGRRPAFTGAAPPETAAPLIEALVAEIVAAGIPCRSGIFGARMDVQLVNSGPVTLLVDVADGRVQ